MCASVLERKNLIASPFSGVGGGEMQVLKGVFFF